MKRRMNAWLILLSMVLMLGGCGNEIPDMTDEQMDLIGEYAAITLLKYDANNRSRLVDLEQYKDTVEKPQKESEQSEEIQESKEPGSIDNPLGEDGEAVMPEPPVQLTLEEVLDLPAGVKMTYLGSGAYNRYPDAEDKDIFFCLEATAGKKLLVLEFALENQSAESVNVDFFHKECQYRIKGDDNYSRSALTTMLLDDLASYVGSISSGGREELILLFEVDEEHASQDLNFSIKNDEDSYTIPVK